MCTLDLYYCLQGKYSIWTKHEVTPQVYSFTWRWVTGLPVEHYIIYSARKLLSKVCAAVFMLQSENLACPVMCSKLPWSWQDLHEAAACWSWLRSDAAGCAASQVPTYSRVEYRLLTLCPPPHHHHMQSIDWPGVCLVGSYPMGPPFLGSSMHFPFFLWAGTLLPAMGWWWGCF